MMQYTNYIFDLYGTLVDIHTDEGKPELWRSMAGWYSAYGADWSAEELQQAYWRMVREEEEKLAAATGSAYPEITLETVFLRLLEEAPESHEASERPRKAKAGKSSGTRSGKPRYSKAEQTWAKATANMFRVLSRERLCCFPGVPEMLWRLKQQGCSVFLLSNAQSVFTMPEMEQCGIADCFDDIFISSDRGIKKPDPRFLAELMQKHSMDPAETVMIGNDPLTDMAVAKACGIAGILVSSDGRDIPSIL